MTRDLSDTDVSRLLRLAGPRPAAPADVSDRVHDAVRAHWRAKLVTRRRRRWITGASLATAAALLSALVWVRQHPETPKLPATAAVVERVVGGGLRGEPGLLGVGSGVPTGAWLETSATGRAALRLPSGVSLRLDAGTRVQILSSTSAWLERGGVYVDSGEAAAAAPVQISTREGQVREVGTQFQVRAGNDSVQVRVREGLVILVGGGGRHEAPAGSRLDIAAGRVRRGETPSHGPEWFWVEQTAPEYTLEGQPLDAFLQWAARETGRHIRFRDEMSHRSTTSARLHGSTRGLTPSEALEAVLPASGLTARLEGDTLWIAVDAAR